MEVRPHKSQHEIAEELPIISESATVVKSEAMDRNRKKEVKEEVASVLKENGCSDLVTGDGRVNWNGIDEIKTEGVGKKTKEKLTDLVERYRRPYPSLVRIRFDAKEEFDFVAGQYVTVSYRERARPYSISCSPNDEDTEICVRRVPDGRLSPMLCDEVEEGDKVTVRGPNGDLLLEEKSERDIVFMATGTGVAPLKSMIDYIFEENYDEYKGTERDIWLFLGAGWEDDLAYREDFRQLDDENMNFHFVPCLTREKHLTDWEGETDYVQKTMLKYLEKSYKDEDSKPAKDIEARIDPNNLEVYACGINAMVYSLVDAVEEMGVEEECINCEGYG